MRANGSWRWLAAAAIAAASCLGAWRAQALPRYAARYEQNCALCHLNPSGGGMRTAYASRDLVPRELAWMPASTDTSGGGLDPRLGRDITAGADMRQLYVGSDRRSETRNFFQMQGDVYLAFQLDPKAALVFDRGLSNTYEVFGVFHPRSWAYLKAGRFIPAYGWKFDDHTRAVRRDLGFEPPGNSDVGVEVGFIPPGWDVQLAALNGNRGATFDRDDRLAFAGTGLGRFRVGPFGLAAGASFYHEPSDAADLTLAGIHGYATLGALTWLGEVDGVRRESSTGSRIDGLATSHEVSVLLRQGLEALATYDFLDPDLDLESGARARYGAGLFVMPKPWLGAEALLRRTEADDGPAITTEDFTELVFQLHLLY